MLKTNTAQLRNLFFGAEDSLVSTLGLLFGIASTAQFSQHQVVVTGLIAISVEALSMGAGSFLSESSTQEIDKKAKFTPASDGMIMFISYLLFGLVPLLPYLFFEVSIAKYVSVISSFFVLFILGYLPAKKATSGIRMVVVAGAAALAGFAVAHLFKI